ncbi:MAG: SNF2-related protein, partial [Terriglobales bacterium]
MLTWTKLHSDDGLEASYQRELAAARRKALALGLDSWLYPFQFEDVVRASLKQSLLLTYQMGLGKTRVAIALALLYGCQRNLLVVPKRLMGEWVTEFRTVGLAQELHIVETLEDCEHFKRFNLVALTALWRLPDDSPLRHAGDSRFRRGANYRSHQRGDRVVETLGLRHSLASILRKQFGFIAVDEAYSLKDVQANQTRAVTYLQAKHKVLLTGTPVRGYPNNILSLLNWAFGNGSAVWPEYSFFVEGAVEKFLRRFGTYVYYDEQHRRTGDRGKKKLLPKIRDPHGFQEM